MGKSLISCFFLTHSVRYQNGKSYAWGHGCVTSQYCAVMPLSYMHYVTATLSTSDRMHQKHDNCRGSGLMETLARLLAQLAMRSLVAWPNRVVDIQFIKTTPASVITH